MMDKICLSLSATLDWETIKRETLKAEESEYHSVWFGDHIMSSPFFGAVSRLECWTLISALASHLDTLRFGPLVLANSFRNPSLLAKMAATLDVIGNGRLEMGIGAGGVGREYEAYGYECPPPAVRVRQMEEGIRIMKMLWTEEKPSFKGKYYQIRDAVCEPKPVQKPYPPLTVGGSGERLTLKVIAKEADRCNFLPCGPEKYKHLLDVLREHCKNVGRDYDEIEKSLYTQVYLFRNQREMEARSETIQKQLEDRYQRIQISMKLRRPLDEILSTFKERSLFGTVEDCIEKLRVYKSLGVTCFILRFQGVEHGVPGEEGFRLFNEHILDEIQG
jgi:alkanesulfonate monooxygenase SsuD/methylene tetrahydromethanopterin reductase-like flavin-dependent oxidoreductase (luciferase family)